MGALNQSQNLGGEGEPQKPNLTAFFGEHQRLPRFGDSTPPWEFRGWAIPYIIRAHEQSEWDRWGYHLRILETGQLPEEPIPQIRFAGTPSRSGGMKQIAEWEKIIDRDRGGSWHPFGRLIDWLAWALALSSEAPALSEETNEALYRAVDLKPWIVTPYDYFGDWLAERGSQEANGFYPTPHEVCELMARMTIGDSPVEGLDQRLASVCDPAVGTGRMLLHASNYSLNLYGQDISGLVVKICQINGALWAPWLSFPLPASALGLDSVPAPPPAPLPVPEANQTPEPKVRVDDRGQGCLF